MVPGPRSPAGEKNIKKNAKSTYAGALNYPTVNQSRTYSKYFTVIKEGKMNRYMGKCLKQLERKTFKIVFDVVVSCQCL